MKRFILCTLFVVAFGVSNHAQAQFRSSDAAWGFSGGGAHGGNNGGDKWVMQYRGFLQYELISPVLIGQLGVGYSKLESPGVYSAETGMADLRLLFSPFSLTNLNPYLYGGFGLSKALNSSGTDYLPMVPFGAGIQTRISRGVLLDFSGGYSLSLSDQLDGRVRADNDLNDLTNKKQDGFYGFSIGLAFTIGTGYEAAEELRKKELADAEARRVKAEEDAWHARELAQSEARLVKQQADADAEARRVKESTDAEARNVKGLADAEALRVKQQADADAEALRVKEATDAEARRVKDLADAEARRLAEQKSHDTNTLIILERGKTVVLKGVTFEFNKATLTNESETTLTMAYNALIANPDAQVVVTGHTDNVGGQQSNQVLSLKRAQAVRNWLVNKGIASNRMRTVGKGKNEPVASNETDAGRAENRRIEFFVQR
jgi:outer membrane protein OmpA-like peptidoglycan-associated protein